MKPVLPENTTDMPLVTDKCYHIILYNPHPLILILMLTLFVVIYKEENNILNKLIQHWLNLRRFNDNIMNFDFPFVRLFGNFVITLFILYWRVVTDYTFRNDFKGLCEWMILVYSHVRQTYTKTTSFVDFLLDY